MKRFITVALLIYSNLIFGQSEPITSLKGQAAASGKFTSPQVNVPYNQATKVGGGKGLIETDSENLLVNPNFEHTVVGTGWTVAGSNTLTATSTSADLFSGLKAGLLTTNSTNVFSLGQALGFNAGLANSQGEMTWAVSVPSGVTDAVICAQTNGVDQNCVPTVNNGVYREYSIPFVFPTTGTVGILLKTTATYASGTQTIKVDKARIRAGLSVAVLNGDTVYSADVSPTGVVSNENVDFINGNCVVTDISLFTCTYVLGKVTQAMKCIPSVVNDVDLAIATPTAAGSSAAAVIRTGYSNGTATMTKGAYNWKLICQKGPTDYAASAGSAYTASNSTVAALYTGAPATGTLGAAFNITTYGTRVQDTHLAYSAGTYTVPVSGKYSMSWAASVNGTYNSAQQLQCNIYINGTAKYQGTNAPTAAIGRAWVNASVEAVPLNLGDLVTVRCYDDGTALSYEANAPANYFSIVKVDSNLIVGSFSGVPSSSGGTGKQESFSLCFGGTTCANNCTAGTCFSRSSGSGQVVAFSSAGTYTLSFGKTVSSAICTGNSTVAGTGPGIMHAAQCTACSSLTVSTTNPSGTATSTASTVSCTLNL